MIGAMQIVVGTVIDRWRVEAEIGRGGMARVYRVRHNTLDRVMALKVLSVQSAELRERLLREGRLQARLEHPNLVAVRDVLALPEGPGLLMDLVDGPNLDGWVTAEHPDAAERERVFREILAGVDHAHAHGVVHRDLKPANIGMERRGGVWMPRITDFGVAKLFGSEGEDDSDGVQSRTGRPMGTPAYMAPEQVRSAKHVDHRADIFALGCILYELMCGCRTFVGQDSLEVFNRVTQGRFVPPRDLARELPERLELAVLGALALDPEQRIPNCATLARVMAGTLPWRLAEGSPPSGATATMLPDSATDWPVQQRAASPGVRPVVSVFAPPGRGLPPALATVAGGATVAGAVVAGAVIAGALFAEAWMRGPAPGATPMDAQVVSAAPVVAAPVVAAPVVAAPAVAAPAVAAPAVAAPAVAAPVVAAPAVAAPVTAPKSVAAAATMGDVQFSGDARSVLLRGSDNDVYGPGAVPPGSYTIEAVFDAGAVNVGTVTVRAGVRARFECLAATLACLAL
jgi:hypothetical protein